MSKIVYITYGIPVVTKNIDSAYAEDKVIQPNFYRFIKKAVKQNMPWVDEVITVNEGKFKLVDDNIDYSLCELYDSGKLYLARDLYERKILDKYEDDTIFIAAPGNVFPVREVKKAALIVKDVIKEVGAPAGEAPKYWSALSAIFRKSNKGYVQTKDIVLFTKDTIKKVYKKSFQYKICNNGYTEVDMSVAAVAQLIKGGPYTSSGIISDITEKDIENNSMPSTYFARIMTDTQVTSVRNNYLQLQLEKNLLKTEESAPEEEALD